VSSRVKQLLPGEGRAERVLPRAFDGSLLEDDDRALFNPDPSSILGRKSAGTMRLSVEQVGLR
jgi:phage head maturation protease